MEEIKQQVFPTNKLIENNMQNKSTYLSLEIKDSEGKITSIIDFDLMFFREKGEEKKYFNIISEGYNPDEEKNSKVIVSIDNKEDFMLLKDYFNNLEWND